MYRRRFSRYPRRKILRRRRGLGKKRVSKSVKRYVKRAISRNLENKNYVQLVGAQNVIDQSNSTGLVSNTFACIPSISQGTGAGQRIGDEITVKSFGLKGFISRTQAGSSSQFCRVVIYSLKDYNADVTGFTLPSVAASNFFRSGGTTATANGYAGNDIMLPINRDRFNVYMDKTFSLSTNVVPVNASSGQYNHSSNTFCRFYINLRKHLKKWKFDENAVNQNLPTNHNLFCTVLLNAMENTIGGGTAWCTAQVLADIKFEDA